MQPAAEAAACECCGIIRSEFSRLVEGRQVPNPLSGVSPSLEARGQSTVGDGAPRPRRKPRSRSKA